MTKDPLSFLDSSNYCIYNRSIAKVVNVNASIMLSELINRRQYHTVRNELTSNEKHGDGWFYLTLELAEERTCLSRREQDSALKILKEKELIDVILFGMPAKRYFRIKDERVLDLLGLTTKDFTVQTSLAENAKLDCTKPPNQFGGKRQTGHIIYKNTKKEQKEEEGSDLTVGLSSLLFDKLKEINPKHKEPNFSSWAMHIERMIRLDERTPEEIRQVIEWLPTDSFWIGNIQSTEKLRQQFDKLWIAMNKPSKKKQEQTKNSQQADMLRKNKEIAKKYYKMCEESLFDKKFIVYDTHVSIGKSGTSSILNFLENGFEAQLKLILEKNSIKMA